MWVLRPRKNSPENPSEHNIESLFFTDVESTVVLFYLGTIGFVGAIVIGCIVDASNFALPFTSPSIMDWLMLVAGVGILGYYGYQSKALAMQIDSASMATALRRGYAALVSFVFQFLFFSVRLQLSTIHI